MRIRTCLLCLAACSGSGGTSPSSPFTVVSVSPVDDATGIGLDEKVTLELSAPPPADFDVELATVAGDPIPHAVAIDGTTVTVTPGDPLWLVTDYKVVAHAASLAAPFASKFATRDGAWHNVALQSQPAMVAAAPLGGGAAPDLATLADGTVFIGWEGGDSVYDQKYTPGAGWLAMPNSLTISGGDPDFVRVAAASRMRAVAGYEKYITRASIEARTYDGAQWSAPVTVAPYNVGGTYYDQFFGGIAATDQTYAITFHRGSFSSDHFDLFVSIHSNGAWSAPIALEQLDGTAASSDIIADGRGGYVVAWSQRAADNSTAVWTATLSSTGTLGTPQKLDDGVGAVYSLMLARGGDTVWVAWAHQHDDIDLRVVAQPLGGSAHTVDLHGFSTGGEWARLAAGAHGAAFVYTQFGSVHAAFANGQTWSDAAELAPIQPDADAGRPVIALDDRGNAAVAWTRVPRTGNRTTMVARGVRGTWSTAEQLGAVTGSTYVWSSGVDTTGRVTTAWTQSESTGYTVWSAQLE